MKGFVLFILASVLWLPLTVINIIVVMIRNVNKHGFLRVLDGYFYETAIDIDAFGNSNFRTLWNGLFQRNGVRFGDRNETISSVLGKNQRDGTLTFLGRVLCFILDTIDKNHCKNSINDTES